MRTAVGPGGAWSPVTPYTCLRPAPGRYLVFPQTGEGVQYTWGGGGADGGLSRDID